MSTASQSAVKVTPVSDSKSGIVIGGGYRLPAVKLAPVTDSGKLRLGGGYRLPSKR